MTDGLTSDASSGLIGCLPVNSFSGAPSHPLLFSRQSLSVSFRLGSGSMVLSSGAPLRNVHLCPTGHTEFSLGKGGPREGYIGMYLSATLGCSFDCSKAPFLVVSWDSEDGICGCFQSPRLAQLVEHSTDTRKVLGSNPKARTLKRTYMAV